MQPRVIDLSRSDNQPPALRDPAIASVRAKMQQSPRLASLVDPNGAVVLDHRPYQTLRMAALAVFGVFVGATSILVGASLVRAGSDSNAGIFEFVHAESRARREQARQSELSRQNTQAQAQRVAASARNTALPGNAGLSASTPSAERATRIVRPASMRSPGADELSGNLQRRTVCVRMCDGYHFPIGSLRNDTELPGHQRVCQSMCPGAPVKLFTVANGKASIAEAVASDGQIYSALPMAWAHERASDPTCQCHIDTERSGMSVFNDPTLRRGDVVVTDTNAKVFDGGARKSADAVQFVDFRQSRALSAADRRSLEALIGISQREATLRAMRRDMKARPVRRAADKDVQAKGEAPLLIRSGTSSGERTTVRVITPWLYTDPR